jgi:hypothetical protein
MSQAGAQAAAFYRDVAENRRVWTIRDSGGYPAPMGSTGCRAQPFWSSLARVERIIRNVPAYAGFYPEEISWDAFRDRWIPKFIKDNLKIGVNWSGPKATGFDIEAEKVKAAIEYQMASTADNR